MQYKSGFVRFSMILLSVSGFVRGEDWPQWMGPTRDGNWAETGIIRKLPEKLTPLWKADVAGGYSGPAVAGGKVFVLDYLREAGNDKNDPNNRAESNGKERIQCLNAETGKELWTHEYDCKYQISYPCGPRVTPTVLNGKVFSLGAEGDFRVLDIETGKLLWKKNFPADFKAKTPIWGFCSHPLVIGNRVYMIVGGEKSAAVCFDVETGKEIWKSLSAREPGYSTPVLIEHGGKSQLILFLADSLNSLDPETGDKYWSLEIEPSYGMAIMMPRLFEDHLYAGAIDNISLMAKLDPKQPMGKVDWRGDNKRGLYPVCPCPIVEADGTMYGVDRRGELRGVEFKTGKRLWQSLEATTGDRPVNSGTAFLTKNGDHYYLFNEKGELIVAQLSKEGYKEISRSQLLEATGEAFGRKVVWSHPAYAEKSIFARNDKELVRVSLAE